MKRGSWEPTEPPSLLPMYAAATYRYAAMHGRTRIACLVSASCFELTLPFGEKCVIACQAAWICISYCRDARYTTAQGDYARAGGRKRVRRREGCREALGCRKMGWEIGMDRRLEEEHGRRWDWTGGSARSKAVRSLSL